MCVCVSACGRESTRECCVRQARRPWQGPAASGQLRIQLTGQQQQQQQWESAEARSAVLLQSLTGSSHLTSAATAWQQLKRDSHIRPETDWLGLCDTCEKWPELRSESSSDLVSTFWFPKPLNCSATPSSSFQWRLPVSHQQDGHQGQLVHLSHACHAEKYCKLNFSKVFMFVVLRKSLPFRLTPNWSTPIWTGT